MNYYKPQCGPPNILGIILYTYLMVCLIFVSVVVIYNAPVLYFFCLGMWVYAGGWIGAGMGNAIWPKIVLTEPE